MDLDPGRGGTVLQTEGGKCAGLSRGIGGKQSSGHTMMTASGLTAGRGHRVTSSVKTVRAEQVVVQVKTALRVCWPKA